MSTRFNIVFDLPRNRWNPALLPTRIPDRWSVVLSGLREMWEIGEDTVLVTAFVDYLDGNPDPLHRRL